MNDKALVLGATGLVGAALVKQLVADARYDEVRVLARRRIELSHPKLRAVLVDFERLFEHREAFTADHVFCCLGTTINKAGSQAAFRRVDYDYVLSAARLAAEAGAKHFVWISAVGASAKSPAFYTRVKGELEDAIANLPLTRWTAVRPSLLLGDRHEHRLAEKISIVLLQPLARMFVGSLRRYRPIEAAAVANAMMGIANGEKAPAALEVRSGPN